MKNFLYGSLSILSLTLALCAYEGTVQLGRITNQTLETEKELCVDLKTLSRSVSVIGAASSEASSSLALQARKLQDTLTTLSKSVSQTTTDLGTNLNSQITQTNQSVLSVAQSVQQTTQTLDRSLETLTEDSHQLLSNPDNGKVVRDLRQTLAITGHAMSHVSAVADAVAVSAPEMAQSVNGITSDVHKLTSDLTKPKPWWKKTLGYLGDGAKIGGAIF